MDSLIPGGTRLTGCGLVGHVVVVLVDGRSLVLWLTNHRSRRWRVDVGQDTAGDSLRREDMFINTPGDRDRETDNASYSNNSS